MRRGNTKPLVRSLILGVWVAAGLGQSQTQAEPCASLYLNHWEQFQASPVQGARG